LKAGVFEQPAIQLDLNATALAAAGVVAPAEWNLDGVNLLPFLTGEKQGQPHDALYWRFGRQTAIRFGDYKLVHYDANVDNSAGNRRQDVTPAKLYQLREDLGESKDLAAAMPEKVAELQAKWAAWNAANVRPLWGNGAADSPAAKPGNPARPQRRGNPQP
jgi:arylsulfatase A-like enzyme